MPRALRVTLIAIGVILLLYGIYYVIGRPAIPLPAIRYPVPAGQPLHNIITATETNQVRVTLNTKGKLEMLSADNELATLDYTPETLACASRLGKLFRFTKNLWRGSLSIHF